MIWPWKQQRQKGSKRLKETKKPSICHPPAFKFKMGCSSSQPAVETTPAPKPVSPRNIWKWRAPTNIVSPSYFSLLPSSSSKSSSGSTKKKTNADGSSSGKSFNELYKLGKQVRSNHADTPWSFSLLVVHPDRLFRDLVIKVLAVSSAVKTYWNLRRNGHFGSHFCVTSPSLRRRIWLVDFAKIFPSWSWVKVHSQL